MSDWLRSLKTNERPRANPSGRSEEMSDREQITHGGSFVWEFTHSLIAHSLISLIRLSLIRSFHSNQMSNCERIVQVAQDKWATMNEWVNHSFFWSNRSCAHFWTKNEWFARKSNDNERIPSPDFSLQIDWRVGVAVGTRPTTHPPVANIKGTNRLRFKIP